MRPWLRGFVVLLWDAAVVVFAVVVSIVLCWFAMWLLNHLLENWGL